MQWKYTFVPFSILTFVLLKMCEFGPLKRKTPMNEELAVMQTIRFNYENTHHKNYMLDKTNYENWPELTKGSEMIECKKYIETLFSQKVTRTVQFAISILMLLHYVEIVSQSVTITGLQCKISPAADCRSYINFIKSPKPDCLYLVRKTTSKANEVTIADEICQNHKYNFWNICKGLPGDCAQVVEGRMRNVRHARDGPQKRKEYEIRHFEDYMLNKDDYVKWPELMGTNTMELCHTLLNELVPMACLSEVVNSEYFILLKYSEIKSAEFTEIYVKLLRCYHQNKGQRYFQFIRAPMPGGVYMVKQTFSKSGIYQITKLICNINGLHHNKEEISIEPCKIEKDPQHGKSLEYYQIKKEPQIGNNSDLEFDEYGIKDPSVVNQPIHQFL